MTANIPSDVVSLPTNLSNTTSDIIPSDFKSPSLSNKSDSSTVSSSPLAISIPATSGCPFPPPSPSIPAISTPIITGPSSSLEIVPSTAEFSFITTVTNRSEKHGSDYGLVASSGSSPTGIDDEDPENIRSSQVPLLPLQNAEATSVTPSAILATYTLVDVELASASEESTILTTTSIPIMTTERPLRAANVVFGDESAGTGKELATSPGSFSFDLSGQAKSKCDFVSASTSEPSTLDEASREENPGEAAFQSPSWRNWE
ncbi:hypothetical protein AAF712_015255 [Marasmius tenuissimus]|uniref:Uncharacterized protein n=1 Tax=Marasmius tenuissimus TaxID=585030 RepID=A0ABR2Z8S2_9AGAR